MTYKQHFAVAIKVNGKVLREEQDNIFIPFGSEFSVALRNLNSRRAKVKVSIDGSDVTGNTWLIVPPNEKLELERFILNGNLKSGNRFKFIERTDKIESHRGIKVDDGLVRVEYYFEKEKLEVPDVYHYPVYRPRYYDHYPYWPTQPTYTLGGLSGGISQMNVSGGLVGSVTNTGRTGLMKSSTPTRSLGSRRVQASSGAVNASYSQSSFQSVQNSMQAMNVAESDAGITVPGSESRQEFVSGGWFETESSSHVIVLKLKGAIGEKPVTQPVTVSYKPVCEFCGRTNSTSARFCQGCGAAVSVL